MIKRINGFVIAFRHNTLNFINTSKTNYLLNHPIYITPDTDQLEIFIIQFFFSKMLFVPRSPTWSLPTSLKNFTSKFAFKKQIKSHLLASQSKQYFNYQSQHQLYFIILFPKKNIIINIIIIFKNTCIGEHCTRISDYYYY